jgi:hypothetical protein
MAKLYSYIVTKDRGFAPNPFWGWCTLACCKPMIRRMAQKGDWVAGLTPRSRGNKLLYAMRITEDPLRFDQYFRDKRFQKKKPHCSSNDPKVKCGDNIYKPRGNDRYRQLPSWHSDDDRENEEQKKKDLRGEQVLVSREFYYFGSEPVPLPDKLGELICGRGHKCRFSEETIVTFARFIKNRHKHHRGVNALPTLFSKDDDSKRCKGRKNKSQTCK